MWKMPRRGACQRNRALTYLTELEDPDEQPEDKTGRAAHHIIDQVMFVLQDIFGDR